MANKQSIIDAAPIQPVVTVRVGNLVMVGQDQMKHVIETFVKKDTNITDRLATPS
ncbi:hypothetical protein Poly41_22610 [Novipirellula artificiosorum]|uniref:Uncharacterized protein n=1 Tax=Novipirellula artificiosorum TaxID=2528016 RepID=A0A5C6DU52_9BACT|nr:hypothetical protein Poly41_22610 [Novipirellula artificiosorum]